jgi:hypothetical protein
MVAGSSFRLADGKTEMSQTTGNVDMVPRDFAPSLFLPKDPAESANVLPMFLQALDLKIIDVGPKTYLLSNPGYTEAVTEVGSEVFLFDSTQGSEPRKTQRPSRSFFPMQAR